MSVPGGELIGRELREGDPADRDARLAKLSPFELKAALLDVAAASAARNHLPLLDAGRGNPNWVAEIWVDPDWYEVQEAEPADPCPPSGMPEVIMLHGPAALIGRVSKSRNIHPEIDCAGDTSVSRRQAELTLSNDRWFVEDLESTNGTYAAPASGPLPKDPITPGQKRELGDNDRVYVGAWTRIVVRPATAQEKKGS